MRHPITIVIADDLTGALDSSVAFAGRGAKVVCALSSAHFSKALECGADVVAVSTNSRENTELTAVYVLEGIIEMLSVEKLWSEVNVFLKVDSRLKGHVAASIAALRGGFAAVRVSPAIPQLDRLVKKGMVCGAGVAQPIPVAAQCGVPPEEVYDAENMGDLEAIVASAPERTLIVGAAGLADAFAAHLMPEAAAQRITQLPAPALFAIGSRDPITVAQLADLRAIPAPNGQVPPMQAASDPLTVLQMTQGIEECSAQDAGAQFAQGVAALVAQTAPATLLACGGESAAAILRLLDCGLLQVEGEVLAGLPVSTLMDGRKGMRLITKSGGFGGPETLVQVAEKLVNSSET